MSAKEFRLVFYMNATDAINFWGGRAAASPLAYCFHINEHKKSKVFLGGAFQFKGLGKYKAFIKDELERASKPISLPLKRNFKNREQICISNKAYIYQNNDPLFTQAEHKVYWEATIDQIGNRFTQKTQREHTLGAVRIGLNTNSGQNRDEKRDKWQALVSELVRREIPVSKDKDKCPWKVYGRKDEQPFWGDSGMPSISRNNAFVHATTDEWRKFDESPDSKILTITNVTDVIDDQIKNSRIRESLVHELLKKIFARDGWWVNFEVPIRGSRIDFLVKRNADDPWKVIEVKLKDNPGAVEQLHDYINKIVKDVRKNKDDSYFWPLWNGRGWKRKGCTKPKGVVLCAVPGTEILKEVEGCNYDYDVWTYQYKFKDYKLGIEIRDARSKKLIAKT